MKNQDFDLNSKAHQETPLDLMHCRPLTKNSITEFPFHVKMNQSTLFKVIMLYLS